MPHRKKPITFRPKTEDESIGNPPGRRGPHREGDEALPGKGGTKGGLNKASGAGTLGTRQNAGLPHGRSHKPKGLKHHHETGGRPPRRELGGNPPRPERA